MDLSPIGTIGELVRYVSDYMSKSEPGSLDNEITQILQRAKSAGSSGKCAAIQKVAKLLEAKRTVSIQEAIFLLLHLPYKLSSRKIVFINLRQPSERARLMWKEAMAESLVDAARVVLDRDAFYANIFERYSIRPQSMQKITLYEFASNWEVDYKKSQKTPDRDSDDEYAELDDAPFRIEETALETEGCTRTDWITHVILKRETLEDRKHTVIKQRLKAAVISTPNFNHDTQAENFYYNLVVLFLPFRTEDQLIQAGDSRSSLYSSKK